MVLQGSAAYKTGERVSKFGFTRVWDRDVDQRTLFEKVMLPVVNMAIGQGTNGLVFAYGASQHAHVLVRCSILTRCCTPTTQA